MQKDDLKSLVTQIYDNLIENIDSDNEASKEKVMNFLKDSVEVLGTIDDNDINSITHAKSVFKNAYKEIADKSLNSYKNTNGKFAELAQLHEEAISEFKPGIDLAAITGKFNEIQSHMSEEVKKANEIISQLSQQVKTLEETSNIDSLTRVFNRRALNTYLNGIFSNGKLPYDLHLLLLDIDDFKVINDTHGHIAGDKILIFIANILRKTLRDGDKIFRYGGEEFVIILNRLDEEHCKIITQRLIKLVQNNKLIYKGIGLTVTASIGTTKLKTTDTQDTLIARADKALYRAKQNGKNQMQTEL